MSFAGSRRALGTLALFMLGGCSSIEMELPPDFLQLQTGGFELKAITPDDARLWVREFEDRDQGDLQFWASSLKVDLEENRGYSPVEETELRDDQGREGIQMRFALTTEGEPHGYLVAVFVFEGSSTNTIRVAEFVAPSGVFQHHLEGVKAALVTIKP